MAMSDLINKISDRLNFIGAVNTRVGNSFVSYSYETKAYTNAIGAVRRKVKDIENIDEKIAFLKLIRQSVIDDIACDYKNRILYKGHFKDNEHRVNLCFHNYDRNSNPLFASYETKYICDLRKNNVVSFPWHIDRFMNTFHYISKENFQYDRINHYVFFFPQLNLYIANNGLHSISAGVTSKQGFLPCHESYDISLMFDSIYTDDGIHWLNRYDSEYKDVIGDFRFAIIYTISKMIWDESPLYLKYSYYFVIV